MAVPCGALHLSREGVGIWTDGGLDRNVCGLDRQEYPVWLAFCKRAVAEASGTETGGVSEERGMKKAVMHGILYPK